MDNFGVITIEQGEIDEEGLIKNLRELFDQNWDWQLKKSDEYSYIVRFPPDRKVEKLVIGKASVFDLNKTGVVGSLSVWNGEAEPIGSLQEVWVQIKGIPPKWVDWGSLREVASSLGILIDIDWQGLFNNFFCMVRVKILCKDPPKVPKQRVFVFKTRLYLLEFKTEGFEQVDGSSDGGSDKGGDEDPLSDDDLLGEELKDSENNKKMGEQQKQNNTDKGQSSVGSKGSKGSNVGQKSAKRELLFEDTTCDFKTISSKFANLLKAMELDEDEDEPEEVKNDVYLNDVQEEIEQLHLPEEWVFHLHESSGQPWPHINTDLFGETICGASKALHDDKEGEISESQVASEVPDVICTQPSQETSSRIEKELDFHKDKKAVTRKQWGPILPMRSSRNLDNGKSIQEKAQEVKRKWNLDDQKEVWMEEHGNASFQDHWSPSELDDSLSSRQEDGFAGLYRQDKSFHKNYVLAATEYPRHYLKFHRRVSHEDGQEQSVAEIPVTDPAGRMLPWWGFLEASMNAI